MARMPQVTARELVRFPESQGFAEQRQSGSHLTLLHAGRGASVTVPVQPGTVPPGLLRKFINDAGLTSDEFRELL